MSTAITIPKVLADIAMMLWHDYALPYARHILYGDVAPVEEAMLFMTRLAKKMPRWLEGAIATAKHDRVAVQKKQELRQRLRIATADIFRVCSEASHIRQLAVDLGDIPSPDRDYLSMSTCDRQVLADVYGESAFEYLQPAYRQVGDERIARASGGQLFPLDGPPCAYAALFPEHACFDSLRQRYLDRGAAVDVQGALHGLLGRCPRTVRLTMQSVVYVPHMQNGVRTSSYLQRRSYHPRLLKKSGPCTSQLWRTMSATISALTKSF